jgi:CRP/FNR family cyclic AMP-dependent transcriptional regulator
MAETAAHRHSETLARCAVLADLGDSEINRLNTQCVWRRFDAGAEILSHQDATTDVYFVAAGTVRVIIASVQGKDTVFRDIEAGDYFGEMSAIDGKGRSASVVARTNATVAKMPAHVFRDLAMTHPAVCYRILERAVRQIRYLSERINEFRTLDVRHRIYVELLRLSRTPAAGNGEGVISPPPTHQEIADRVSTRREAVARELKQLERDGHLRRRRGALVIPDPAALTEMVEKARQGLEEDD